MALVGYTIGKPGEVMQERLFIDISERVVTEITDGVEEKVYRGKDADDFMETVLEWAQTKDSK